MVCVCPCVCANVAYIFLSRCAICITFAPLDHVATMLKQSLTLAGPPSVQSNLLLTSSLSNKKHLDNTIRYRYGSFSTGITGSNFVKNKVNC